MTKRSRRGLLTTVGVLMAIAVPQSASADTFSITAKTDDSTVNGNCTLREAVQAASTNTAVDACGSGSAGRDTIQLGIGTYDVTIDGFLEDLGETGDIDIQAGGGPLEIIGEGVNETTIKVSSNDRGFDVRPAAGSVLIGDLTVEGNDDRQNDGGLFTLGGSTETTFNNTYLTKGQAQFGGAVYCDNGCDLTMTNSTVADNSVTASGTGFPNVIARGGAVDVNGTARFDRVSMTSNEAIVNDSQARGGGLSVTGVANVKNSYIGDNQTRSSTNNAASVRTGGGIQVLSGGLVNVVNSTMSGNTADPTGGSSSGGAVAVLGTGSFNASATTFASNNAGTGTAVAANGGDAVVGTSIVSSFDQDAFCSESNGGDVETSGFNVLDRQPPPDCFSGLSASDDEVGNPGLPLSPADNGGITLTYALEPNSTPIDFVPKSECSEAGKEDQRGAERPFGKKCDAGAYEYTECLGQVVDGAWIFGTPANDVILGNGAGLKFAPSAGNDKLKAGGSRDFICTGSGNDKIKALGGNDKIDAGSGKDKIDGGTGRDSCTGGPGKDKAKACERKKSI